MTTQEPLLSVEHLVVRFRTELGIITAVDGASYAVARGETLGVVGESGSGKSATVRAALGLLPRSARVDAGRVRFEGRDLLTMSQRGLEQVRGRDIGFVAQDPMTALNPVMTLGAQLAECITAHDRDVSRTEVRERVVQALADVGIPHPAARARQYPHEFSGGMRQRAAIAMAIINGPSLIVADEPTTALDVTIQAQVLDLLCSIQQRSGAGLVLITHDLGVVAEIADAVVVMYGGRVVERAGVDSAFHGAAHPYTQGLLRCLPRLFDDSQVLAAISGQPPNPLELPEGCAFRPRCDRWKGRVECTQIPELRTISPGHSAACHFAEETWADREGK